MHEIILIYKAKISCPMKNLLSLSEALFYPSHHPHYTPWGSWDLNWAEDYTVSATSLLVLSPFRHRRPRTLAYFLEHQTILEFRVHHYTQVRHHQRIHHVRYDEPRLSQHDHYDECVDDLSRHGSQQLSRAKHCEDKLVNIREGQEIATLTCWK